MLLRALLVLGLVWIGGSYLGAVHPLGDSLAVFRIFVAAALLPVALLCWRWWVGKGAVLLLVAILGARIAFSQDWTPVEEPDLTLYQKNLLYRRADRAPFLADVAVAAPDFLTLQEVSTDNLTVLVALEATYPYQHMCEGRAVGAVAILSRYPLRPEPCPEEIGLAAAVADTPLGPVRILSLHLHWPFPFSQADHVEALLPHLSGAEAVPVIVGGDFNMVPWGRSVARVQAATGALSGGHIEPTWTRHGIGIMIDHVFAGPDAQVQIEVRPRLKSDHHGVLARIAF